MDFKHVYICGINDRLLDNIDESKKLLYVGMTRARDTLKITYSVDNDIVAGLIKVKIKARKDEQNSVTSEDMVAAAVETEIVEEKSKGGLFAKIKGLFKV